jgi:hypothetical protein
MEVVYVELVTHCFLILTKIAGTAINTPEY